jgi:hypothetical protein
MLPKTEVYYWAHNVLEVTQDKNQIPNFQTMEAFVIGTYLLFGDCCLKFFKKHQS